MTCTFRHHLVSKGLAAIKIDKEFIENAYVLAMLAWERNKKVSMITTLRNKLTVNKMRVTKAENERKHNDTTFNETSPELCEHCENPALHRVFLEECQI